MNKKEVYREMASKVGETLEYLEGNPRETIAFSLKADTKPSFKPNPNLGEGIADPNELRYREKLLAELEKLYDDIGSFIDTDAGTDIKLEALKGAVDSFISSSKKIARDELLKAHDDGVAKAIADLKAINVEVAKEEVDEENIKKLIYSQEVALEKVGMGIYYTFKDYLVRMEIW